MTVLMWATQWTDAVNRSVTSFSRIGGVQPVMLGMGERHSWQARIIGLHRWCAAHPGESVISADAYDTCCVSRIPHMAFDGVCFSAEANCWPDQHLASQYPSCDTRYRYLNAGVWWGSTDAYCEMVEQFKLLSGVDDDQRAYTRAYLGGTGITLDHRQSLCHSRYAAEDDGEIAGGIYWVKSTGNPPLIVHGNGRSDIESVWEAFGV
jgi:hypothetical protein